MNAQNAAQFLPLVQALADGKTIQQQSLDDGWHDQHDVHFGNDLSAYRVKPEPREFWICYDKDESPLNGAIYGVEQLRLPDSRLQIRVSEILD